MLFTGCNRRDIASEIGSKEESGWSISFLCSEPITKGNLADFTGTATIWRSPAADACSVGTVTFDRGKYIRGSSIGYVYAIPFEELETKVSNSDDGFVKFDGIRFRLYKSKGFTGPLSRFSGIVYLNKGRAWIQYECENGYIISEDVSESDIFEDAQFGR